MRDRPGTCLIVLLLAELVIGLALLTGPRLAISAGTIILSGLAGKLIVIVPIFLWTVLSEAWRTWWMR